MTYERPRDERFSERRMHFEAFVLHCASVTAGGTPVKGLEDAPIRISFC